MSHISEELKILHELNRTQTPRRIILQSKPSPSELTGPGYEASYEQNSLEHCHLISDICQRRQRQSAHLRARRLQRDGT